MACCEVPNCLESLPVLADNVKVVSEVLLCLCRPDYRCLFGIELLIKSLIKHCRVVRPQLSVLNAPHQANGGVLTDLWLTLIT